MEDDQHFWRERDGDCAKCLKEILPEMKSIYQRKIHYLEITLPIRKSNNDGEIPTSKKVQQKNVK